VGITATAFTMAPTITALPDELKRLDTVSGESVSENVIHMTALDSSADVYDVRGIGLYLEDGTLFAVYAQESELFRKVAKTTFLFVQDLSFSSAIGGSIVFGDALFLNPPATETVAGVAETATQAEVDTGADDARIVTPLKLRVRLQAVIDALTGLIGDLDADVSDQIDGLAAALAALTGRTITGAGIATGGGSLSANRTITVSAASAAEIAAGVAAGKAITPAGLSGLLRAIAPNGHAFIPGQGGLRLMWGRFTSAANAVTPVSFPDSFATACFVVIADGVKNSGADSQDNPAGVDYGSITASGFSVFSADDSSNACGYIALGV
jgi:hypothetical protein